MNNKATPALLKYNLKDRRGPPSGCDTLLLIPNTKELKGLAKHTNTLGSLPIRPRITGAGPKSNQSRVVTRPGQDEARLDWRSPILPHLSTSGANTVIFGLRFYIFHHLSALVSLRTSNALPARWVM